MKLDPTGQTARDNLHAITDALPDVRIWMIVALFALSWRILEMVAAQPTLLKEGSFMLLVGMVVGNGGLGAAVLWGFGGTKIGSQVMQDQSRAIIASGPAPVDEPISTTTTVTSGPAAPATP